MVAAIQTSPLEALNPFEYGFLPSDLSEAEVLDIDLSALPPEWVLIRFLKWQQPAILIATVCCNNCGFYSHNFPCLTERGVTKMTCTECDHTSTKILVDTRDRFHQTEKQLLDANLMEYIKQHPDYIQYFSIRIDNRYIHTYSNPLMREKVTAAIEAVKQRFYKQHPNLKRYEPTT